MCAPAGLGVLETVDAGDSGAPFPRRVRVTLREGQYHQVKRMLGACGASVDALCRERIGGLSLADLPALAAEGSVMEATERDCSCCGPGAAARRAREDREHRRVACRIVLCAFSPPLLAKLEIAA